MPPLSKRKRQIKKLAQDKRKKNDALLENSNSDDYNDLGCDSDEEIEWGDNELDEKTEKFFKVLSDGMKNYVPPARKFVYIGNSVRTRKRKKAQAKQLLTQNGQQITKFFAPIQPDELNQPDDTESECEDYEQSIKSIEDALNQSDDNGYKLRLTALLHYLRLINHQEPKIKASLCVARQLNKGPYFARCLRVWEKMVKNGETVPVSKRGKHCKIRSLLDDEDVKMQITSYLRENKFEFYVVDLVDYIKNTVFPSLGIEQETTIRFELKLWQLWLTCHIKRY